MEAFTVSAEGLKGVRVVVNAQCNYLTMILQWNANALILESAQAREDRKKRVSYKLFVRHNFETPI